VVFGPALFFWWKLGGGDQMRMRLFGGFTFAG
jgi:hypothetical protein